MRPTRTFRRNDGCSARRFALGDGGLLAYEMPMKLRHGLAVALLPLVPILAAACGETTPPPVVAPPPVPTEAPPVALLSPGAGATPPRADSSLTHRTVFFAEPDRAQPKISPDGKRIAFLAPVDGVLNVWVGSADAVASAK